MTDCNRLLIASTAIALLLCALIWGAVGARLMTQSPERFYAYISERPQPAATQYVSHQSALALANEACAEAAADPGDDTQRDSGRDLCAQYIAAASASQSANYTAWQTWIGGFGLCAVLITLVLNFIATRAATKQSRIAQRALEEAARPILFVSVVHSAFFRAPFDPDPTPTIRFQVENVGERFAQIEIIQAEVRFGLTPPEVKPETFHHTILCGRGRKIDPKTNHFEDEHRSQLDAPTAEEIDQVKYGRTAAFFFGIIRYADPLGIVREHGFCFRGVLFAKSGAAEFYRLTDGKNQYDRRAPEARIPTVPKRERGKPVPFSEERR